MRSRAAQSARQPHKLKVAGAKPASAMDSFLMPRADVVISGVERPGALSAHEVLASAAWFNAHRGIDGTPKAA